MSDVQLWQAIAGLMGLGAVTAILSYHKLEKSATRQLAALMRERNVLISENDRLRDCLAKMQPRDLTR